MTGERTQEATQKLEKIPVETRRRKWLNTASGVALIALGAAMPKFLAFPWYVGASVFGFGCFLVSKELVVSYLRFIPAVIRDIYSASKGK